MLQLYNSQVYNQTYIAPFQVSDPISFDGFGLQNAVYSISTVDRDTTPGIEINSYNKPLNNGGSIISKFFRDKVITMQGTIRAPGSLPYAIDTLKSRLRGTEKFLAVDFNGTGRRVIKATMQNISIVRNHYHIDFVPFTVTFLSKEPFWYEIDTGALLIDNVSADIVNSEFINQGFVEVPCVFRYVGSTTSAVTKLVLTIGGEEMEVVANVGNGDILEINGQERFCLLNGVQVKGVGVYGDLPVGESQFSVDFTGTVDGDVSILYNISYL